MATVGPRIGSSCAVGGLFPSIADAGSVSTARRPESEAGRRRPRGVSHPAPQLWSEEAQLPHLGPGTSKPGAIMRRQAAIQPMLAGEEAEQAGNLFGHRAR